MMLRRWGVAGLLGGLMLGLGACADGYGYSGVSMGYGGGGYYGGPYDDGFGGPAGYGYAPYYGWYGDHYYPGTGTFVYDRYRRPTRWNRDQQRYWQNRRYGWGDRDVRDNWRDFRRDVGRERRDYRNDLRGNRQAFRDGTITRDQYRQGQRDARREYRGDVRREYRELRRENRAEGYATPRPGRGLGGRGFGGGQRGFGGNRGGSRGERPR